MTDSYYKMSNLISSRAADMDREGGLNFNSVLGLD